MARITVDGCLKPIPNRFEMSLAATYRARQITNGAQPMMEGNRDKATVIALRECRGKWIEILKKHALKCSPRGMPTPMSCSRNGPGI